MQTVELRKSMISNCTQYHELNYGVYAILTVLFVLLYLVYRWDKENFGNLFILGMVLIALWWLGIFVNNFAIN